MKPSPWVGMHFTDACREWLRLNRKNMSSRTLQDYHDYLRRLEKHFKQICVNRGEDYNNLQIEVLDNDWLRDYQDLREANYNLVNHELSIITQTRDEMRMHIDGYKPLKKPKDWKSPGKAFTKSEDIVIRRVCRAAGNHPKWNVGALCTLLSLDSGMGPGEIKNVKLENVTVGHVNDDSEEVPSSVYIAPRGAKRPRRERSVALVGDGEWALKKLVERAHQIGCTKPEHFLVPGMNPDHSYNPLKMCENWSTSLEGLQGIADVKFRKYDCRHTAISKALKSSKVSLTAASQHFGHITESLRKEYYHGDIETSLVVAQAIAGRKQAEREQRAKTKQIETDKKPVQSIDTDELADKVLDRLFKALDKKSTG